MSEKKSLRKLWGDNAQASQFLSESLSTVFALVTLAGFIATCFVVPDNYGSTALNVVVTFLLVIVGGFVFYDLGGQELPVKALVFKCAEASALLLCVSYLVFFLFSRTPNPSVPYSLSGIAVGNKLTEDHLNTMKEQGVVWKKIPITGENEWVEAHYELYDATQPKSHVFITLDDDDTVIRVQMNVPLKGSEDGSVDELEERLVENFDKVADKSSFVQLIALSDYYHIQNADREFDDAWRYLYKHNPSQSDSGKYWIGKRNMVVVDYGYESYSSFIENERIKGGYLMVVLQDRERIEAFAERQLDKERARSQKVKDEKRRSIENKIKNKMLRVNSFPVN
tara:strand:- start:29117 stop:30133 length:1017 start_codon:yes stop_codon:yes gene_type:complete